MFPSRRSDDAWLWQSPVLGTPLDVVRPSSVATEPRWSAMNASWRMTMGQFPLARAILLSEMPTLERTFA